MKKHSLILTGMIIIAALSRLIPHPLNFTPITALSLLGVCYMRKSWEAFLVPLLALLLSDLILGSYSYMWSVYGSFLIISLAGYLFARDFSFTGKLLFLFPASLFFFFVTNSAVFFQTELYPKNIAGYISCLIAGIPFLKNSIIGDVFYGIILFGAAEVLNIKFPNKVTPATA